MTRYGGRCCYKRGDADVDVRALQLLWRVQLYCLRNTSPLTNVPREQGQKSWNARVKVRAVSPDGVVLPDHGE